MPLHELRDDEELARRSYERAVAEHDEIFDDPEIYPGHGKRLVPPPWSFATEHNGTFERHFARPAP